MPKTKPVCSTNPSIEICILAGGLSSRMGRDKSKLRLGGRTLLAHIRQMAKTLQFPVRVIRRDLVPRCGPVGGIYTALKSTRAEAVLFLACDMPRISAKFLKTLLVEFKGRETAIFAWHNLGAGFPFLLSQGSLPIVEKMLAEKKYSLQILARKTHAKKFRVVGPFESEVMNINTPGDWDNLKLASSKHL